MGLSSAKIKVFQKLPRFVAHRLSGKTRRYAYKRGHLLLKLGQTVRYYLLGYNHF